jgi:hypothetical protein
VSTAGVRWIYCPVCRTRRARISASEAAECDGCQIADQIGAGALAAWLRQTSRGEDPGYPRPAAPRSWSAWSARDPGGFTAYLATLTRPARQLDDDGQDGDGEAAPESWQARISRRLWGESAPE